MGAMLLLLQTFPESLISIAFFLFLLFQTSALRRSALPVDWPLAGMLPSLLANLRYIHDWSTDLLRESHSTFLLKGPWFLGMDQLVTADPINVHHIFTTNFPNYPKGHEFSEMFDILGDGIFNSDAESWRFQRKTAHRLMGDRRFRSLVGSRSRNKVSVGLVPLLNRIAEDQEMVVDLQDVFLRLTFDLTCDLVFGVDPACLSAGFPAVPFAKAMDDVTAAVFFRHTVPKAWWKLMRWLRIGDERRLAMAWEVIDHFVTTTISNRREDRREETLHHEDTPIDLLTSYIQDPLDGSAAKFSDKFLRDTTLNFMLAGRDTTGVALAWFFWLLSKNPIEEKRIFNEIKTRLSPKAEEIDEVTGVFDFEELGELVYLHAALCESLRLYPSVPFEHKGVVRPEILPSGHRAHPGMKIMVSIYGMGRMQEVWGKDCMEFRPERWITEQGKLRHEPSYKFLAFNAGPRTCLGKETAFTQMKMAAAAMVYNFHVEVVEGHVVEPKLSIILHMKNGLLVRIKKRSKV